MGDKLLVRYLTPENSIQARKELKKQNKKNLHSIYSLKSYTLGFSICVGACACVCPRPILLDLQEVAY